jgi:hypothetical protein
MEYGCTEVTQALGTPLRLTSFYLFEMCCVLLFFVRGYLIVGTVLVSDH